MKRRRVTRAGLLDGMVHRQGTDLSLHTESNVLIYLVHGVTGTPIEMHYVARQLAKQHGWDIYVTTLPGHCTRLKDLVRTTEYDWRMHVQEQLAFARERYEYVFAAGLSAGALLVLDASRIVAIDGVGVLSPTFIYDGWNTPWSQVLLPIAMKIVPRSLQRFFFHRDGPPFGIKDQELRATVGDAYRPASILRDWLKDVRVWRDDTGSALPPSPAASKGYPIFPLTTLTEIDRLITGVRQRLHEVTAPTVIVQAREDDMTSPVNAFIVYNEIASSEKQVILLDDCYHVVTVDKQRDTVAKSLAAFFNARVTARELWGESGQCKMSPLRTEDMRHDITEKELL